MKKQTKVLVAAAMLTLGASFTSMAATYDWQLEDGQWVCYDEEGDVYEDEWCESAGKDYYVGDDGIMLTSQWVDDTYYVDSTGAKTTNAWKFILPADADEDDDDVEAEWFYFGSNGKAKAGKQVIGGKTYYFDSETNVMLTGWVDYTEDEDGKTYAAAGDYSENMVFVGEDGARVSNTWINVAAPEDADEEDPDLYWYYITGKGKAKVGRALDINGETYFFDAEAKMLSGWVATTNGNAFWGMEEGEYISDVMAVEGTDAEPAVYFCGGSDEGWAKKSTWIKEYAISIEDPDSDDHEKSWFWLGSKGQVYTSADNAVVTKTLKNGAEATYTIDSETYGNKKEINNETYAFNQDGEMLSGLVEIDGDLYYFGGAEDGAMKTGEIVIEDTKEEEDYQFYFAKKAGDGWTKGVAVTGAASGDLYENGLLVKADDECEEHKVTIITVDDNDEEVSTVVYFVVDEDGDIKTSDSAFEDAGVNKDVVTFSTIGDAFKGGYTK